MESAKCALEEMPNFVRCHELHPCRAIGVVVVAMLAAVAYAQSPSIAITQLFGFPNPENLQFFPDGATPQAPLIQASDGNFYGTTSTGGDDGNNCSHACAGTVFKVTPQGQVTVLYTFAYPYDNGSTPMGGLVEGPDGYLYGTTSSGGYPNRTHGVVYKISKTGQFQKLYDFCQTDCSGGWGPHGSLILDRDGNFYGTTLGGGSTNSIFQINPFGIFTKLVSFNNDTGIYPSNGLVQASDGNFYGVTTTSVYQFTIGGQLTALYKFGSVPKDGSIGVGPLIQASDGYLYGVTYAGGTNNAGTVFKIGLLLGGYEKILDLSGPSEGWHPNGLLQASDGNLWGTTSNTTGSNSGGAVYTITTDGTLVQSTFPTCATGNASFAPLIEANDGKLYGTASECGVDASGNTAAGSIFVVDAGLPPPPPPTNGKLLGDPSKQPNGCNCRRGDPINVAGGNLFEAVTDYETAGANKLGVTRYYNSQSSSTAVTSLGGNWRSTYDRVLGLSPSAVTATRADGRQLTFTLKGSTWTADSDVDVTLKNNGATWTLTDHNDTVEVYTAISSTEAVVSTITTRNGYRQTLSYNGTELASVTDSYTRSLTFSYGGNGLLSSVTTPDSTILNYGYLSNGGINVLTSVTYPTTPATSLTYLYESNNPFALTGLIDETGSRYATWAYDFSGRALSSQVGTGANANIVSVSYDDSTGNRTVTNALGEQDIYKFTTLQGVPKVVEIDRQATSTTATATRTFTYDARGYLASETDWNGNATKYTNNVHGQPTNIKEGVVGTSVARTTTIAYDKTFIHLPKTITTQGLKTAFVYDSQGNVLTKTLTDTTTTTVPYSTKGQTRTWTYAWSNFLLASVQNPRTDVTAKTTFTYGSDGALTGISNALNQPTLITAHAGGGLPLTVVDPNNVTTTLTYDGRQRLSSSTVSTAAGARTTTYTYSTGNSLQTVTLPDGSERTNSYDSAHRLTGVADNFNDQLEWTLDANGDATQRLIADPGNNTTFARTATFDALGRKLLDTSAVTTKSTAYTYDNNGNALTITDPLNHPATQVFDALNRVTNITDAKSGVTKIAYDQHDRPKTVTAPVCVTTFVYDGFGDAIQQKSPDSGITVYHYDADGNLTQKVLAGGEVSNYTYDALDRVLTATYPADSSLNVFYSYDQSGHGFGIGRLTSLTDASGSLSRTYDERGNLLTETRVNGGKTFTTGYSYDPASRVASIAYPSGTAVSYAHDAAGRISAVAAVPPGLSSTPVVSGMAYLPFGPASSFTFGNGISEARTFDLDYRLGNLTDTGSGSSLMQKLTYGFDDADNVLTITDGVNAGSSQTLGYDVLNRLTGAAGAYGALSYTYDKNGNRLTQKLGTVTTKYKYAAGSNRLASITAGGITTTVGTNANGNITSIPPANSGTAATFAYNAANQLASVTGSPLAASFVYDAFGQRFSKTNPGSNPTLFSYAQDGSLLEENDNGAITDYIYVNGAPFATLAPGTAKLYFIHTEGLGTPQLATDSSQAAVWSTTYQPFGMTGIITGSITQNVRLLGQYAEVETGFNHNGFRDYMPNLGRYLESDPVGLAGGPNTYAYVLNNPMKWTDPWGLLKITDQMLSSMPGSSSCPTNESDILYCHRGTEDVQWQQATPTDERQYHSGMHVYKEVHLPGKWGSECAYRNGLLVLGEKGSGTADLYPDISWEHVFIDPGGLRKNTWFYNYYWSRYPHPPGID